MQRLADGLGLEVSYEPVAMEEMKDPSLALLGEDEGTSEEGGAVRRHSGDKISAGKERGLTGSREEDRGLREGAVVVEAREGSSWFYSSMIIMGEIMGTGVLGKGRQERRVV